MQKFHEGTELSETELDEAAGGFFEAWPCKWSGFSLDGKGNDATTEGGFSDVSGLEAEVQTVEYREGTSITRR